MANLVGGGSSARDELLLCWRHTGFALGPLCGAADPRRRRTLGDADRRGTGLAIAALLVIDVERLKNHMRREQHSQATTIHRDAEWSPFTRLVAAAVARNGAVLRAAGVRSRSTPSATSARAMMSQHRAHGDAALRCLRDADWKPLRRPLRQAPGARLGDVAAHDLLLVVSHLGLIPLFIVLGMVGFTLEAPFATTIVLGQQYLPGRRGLASGITLGLAIGAGGLVATGLGALADAIGVHSTLEVLPVFSLIALACVISLPDHAQLSSAQAVAVITEAVAAGRRHADRPRQCQCARGPSARSSRSRHAARRERPGSRSAAARPPPLSRGVRRAGLEPVEALCQKVLDRIDVGRDGDAAHQAARMRAVSVVYSTIRKKNALNASSTEVRDRASPRAELIRSCRGSDRVP